MVLFEKYFDLNKITTSDLILIFTGLVVTLYTYFTRNLWKESVRQTFLQNTPIPALYVREREGKDILRIRNIGLKPMINTSIEDWNIHFFSSERTEKYNFKFEIPLPNIIAVDEEKDILVVQNFNGNTTKNSEISPMINPKYSPFLTPIHVIFSDISGKKYYTKFLFGRGKLKMSSPIKRYSLFKLLTIKISNSLYPVKEPFIRWNIIRSGKRKVKEIIEKRGEQSSQKKKTGINP